MLNNSSPQTFCTKFLNRSSVVTVRPFGEFRIRLTGYRNPLGNLPDRYLSSPLTYGRRGSESCSDGLVMVAVVQCAVSRYSMLTAKFKC